MPFKKYAIAAVVLGSVMAPTAAGASIAYPSDNVQVVSEWSHPQPGSPVDVLANYQIYEELAGAEPTLWGGAYVDGDSLVIKYVGQTESEASAKLQNAGVLRGFRLSGATVTTADLQAAQTAADGVLKAYSGAVSWGPDYASSGLIVSTTTANAATLDALRAVISPKVPVSVVENAVHPSSTSRYYDTVPYYGGDLIRLTSTSG